MQFRTYQQINALTREQMIVEVLRLDQELAREQTRHQTTARDLSDKLAALRAGAQADLQSLHEESERLNKQVLEDQAEIARLQAARSELVSAELTKLRKQLAEAKGRGG
jgi:phage host-nuclease inhibitor protein Gam